jgi:lysophospholipid acyltransferase
VHSENQSYIFYPGALLAGPWVSFADYCAFIERTGVWSPLAQPPPPSPLLRALGAAVAGTVCAGAHSLLMPRLPDSAFLDASWVASHGVPFKLAYMWAMGFASRCKYYFVWSWADVACRVGGLGWAGWQPKGGDAKKKDDDAAAGATQLVPRWDRCRNVDILGVELATSAAELPQAWNTCTGAWLRHYCYERLLARRVPPFAALLVTQATSGVWHGVYAGYALFFTSSSFMLQAAKVLFRYQRALPPAVRKPFALLHWFLTAFHLNYLAAAFIAVTLPAGRAAWESVHFAGHISMIVRGAGTRLVLFLCAAFYAWL